MCIQVFYADNRVLDNIILLLKSSHRSVYVGTSPAITPAVFVSVVAGFVGVVSLLVICVFAMFRRQKEKNRVLESGTHTPVDISSQSPGLLSE